MKLCVRERLGDRVTYRLHRRQVITPAHKLRAIEAGEPNFSLRNGNVSKLMLVCITVLPANRLQ